MSLVRSSFSVLSLCFGAAACGVDSPDLATNAPGISAHTADSLVRTGKHTRGSNTQLLIPGSRILADVDGDGSSDVVQFQGTTLSVTRTDYNLTPLLQITLDRPIRRVLTGAFGGGTADQVCAVVDTGAMECYGISTDRTTLWWWFTQGSIVASNEEAIVGDFDGDGRDDVLAYNSATGAMRFYSVTGSGVFNPTPNFALGNLTGNLAGLQVRAGDFNGDGRDDLMAVNSGGQIIYWASVNSGGTNTFWWAFTTGGGFVPAGYQTTVARINNDGCDDVVLHKIATGTTSFYNMSQQGNGLAPITNVSTGQIDNEAGALIFWGYMHGALSETGAYYRDDAMVYRPGPAELVRSDARFDGSNLTYWWAYTRYQNPLPVDLRAQETNMWCWAASGQMIMNYLGGNVTQCDEANRRFGRSDCCNSPTPSACIQGGWPDFAGYNFSASSVNGALSWNDLCSQIDARRSPVAFSWAWTGGGGHMMVAIGHKVIAGQNYVTINDPWAPGWGGQYDILYTTYVSGSDHSHWTDFYNISKN